MRHAGAAAAEDAKLYFVSHDQFHRDIILGAKTPAWRRSTTGSCGMCIGAHRVAEYEPLSKQRPAHHDAIVSALISGDEDVAARRSQASRGGNRGRL